MGLLGGLYLGRLSDAKGRKLALLICFACAAAGYTLAGVAAALRLPILLFASRLPIGVAKQSVTIARAIVSDVTPQAERSAALSRLYSAMAFGYAAGPWAGGLLSDVGGQALLSWLCTAGFGAIALSVALLLPETRPPAAPAQPPTAATAAAATTATPSGGRAPPREACGGSRARLRRLIAALALPEAAVLMYTGTALPLLAQHLGWPARSYGTFLSATGVGAGLISLQVPRARAEPRGWIARSDGDDRGGGDDDINHDDVDHDDGVVLLITVCRRIGATVREWDPCDRGHAVP